MSRYFNPVTRIIGAAPRLDPMTGRFLGWDYPRPHYQAPHWKSAGAKAKAAREGITDKMLAGPEYVRMVPVYRGKAT